MMTLQQDDGLAAGNLVSRLLQALQVSRLHSIFNVTLEEPVRELVAALNAHLAAHGAVSFKPDPQAELLFLNDQPVRPRRSAAAPVEGLIRFLGQLGVGELRFLRPVDERAVRAFLSVVKERGAAADAAAVCRHLVEGFEASGLTGVVALLSREQVAARAVRRDTIVDQRLLARLAYARTLTLLREYLRHMRDADLERYFWRRLIRAVQGLHGMLARSSRTLLALTLIKDADEPALNHGVNTCLLTLLVAHKVGVPRAQAVNAGLAALLHGVGKFRTAAEVLAKDEDARTPAEQREYDDHPYRAVGAFLETRRLDDALLIAALVAFQYEADHARRPLQDLHPLARMVAVCEAYDALTSPAPGRPALLPDRALASMFAGRPRAFDEALLGLFAGLLGLYPPGSAVRLDTGELAFVVHPNPDDPRRPLVAVVRDAAGRAVDGAVLDLAETGPRGGHRHSIVGTVDPIRVGIRPPEYMRGE
ncbi:MAG: hypothetical protein KF878_13135 [Planctomycetes bacterium]|nr:hypothetical protein [Planctomycetota bacterium]